jgi:hypothetical protein
MSTRENRRGLRRSTRFMGTGQRKEKLLELVDSVRTRVAKPKSHEHGLQCVTDSCANHGDTPYIQFLSAGMGMCAVTSAVSQVAFVFLTYS